MKFVDWVIVGFVVIYWWVLEIVGVVLRYVVRLSVLVVFWIVLSWVQIVLWWILRILVVFVGDMLISVSVIFLQVGVRFERRCWML